MFRMQIYVFHRYYDVKYEQIDAIPNVNCTQKMFDQEISAINL